MSVELGNIFVVKFKLLNGINTNKYISDKTGFDINEIEKVEYKLENMFLITKCRGIHG